MRACSNVVCYISVSYLSFSAFISLNIYVNIDKKYRSIKKNEESKLQILNRKKKNRRLRRQRQRRNGKTARKAMHRVCNELRIEVSRIEA